MYLVCCLRIKIEIPAVYLNLKKKGIRLLSLSQIDLFKQGSLKLLSVAFALLVQICGITSVLK